MNNSKVTVIMAFYNEEKYILKAIESVLNQTYRNIELIIVNDGSSDNSDSIVCDVSDSRIKYISYRENRRQGYARNRGLDAATGKYIMFFDADDILAVDNVERKVRYLEEHKDIILVSNGYRYIDKDGKEIKKPEYPKAFSDEDIKAEMLMNNVIASGGGALFFRSIIVDNDIRLDEDNIASEDYSFWVQMMKYGKFANLHEPLFFYRIGHGSKSNGQLSEKRMLAEASLRKTIISAWKQSGFSLEEEDYDFIIRNIVNRKVVTRVMDIIEGNKLYDKIKEQALEYHIPNQKCILEHFRSNYVDILPWGRPYMIIKRRIERVVKQIKYEYR